MMSELASLALLASPAHGLDPQAVWTDTNGWRQAPAVTLRGTGGTPAERALLRARWNREWIFFEFRCRDRAVISPGRKDGPDHYKIGDVVEIFLGRQGEEAYGEIHVTPAGRKALFFFDRYRRAAETRPSGWRHAQVRSETTSDGWRSVVAVPWTVFTAENPDKAEWRLLAGRYDRSEESGAAVLSSFPAQEGKPDFHDPARFGRLVLSP